VVKPFNISGVGACLQCASLCRPRLCTFGLCTYGSRSPISVCRFSTNNTATCDLATIAAGVGTAFWQPTAFEPTHDSAVRLDSENCTQSVHHMWQRVHLLQPTKDVLTTLPALRPAADLLFFSRCSASWLWWWTTTNATVNHRLTRRLDGTASLHRSRHGSPSLAPQRFGCCC